MFEVFAPIGYLTFALIISKSDITRRVISNRSLLFFAIFSVLLNIKFLGLTFLISVCLATCLLIAIHLIFSGRVGSGDLKLFWVMTIWSPVFLEWLVFFAWSWILGGIFSIASSLYLRRLGSSIPFAPFIFLGFLASI